MRSAPLYSSPLPPSRPRGPGPDARTTAAGRTRGGRGEREGGSEGRGPARERSTDIMRPQLSLSLMTHRYSIPPAPGSAGGPPAVSPGPHTRHGVGCCGRRPGRARIARRTAPRPENRTVRLTAWTPASLRTHQVRTVCFGSTLPVKVGPAAAARVRPTPGTAAAAGRGMEATDPGVPDIHPDFLLGPWSRTKLGRPQCNTVFRA